MKKLLTMGALALGIFAATTVKAQPVSDHAVIPVAVTLNQVLRLHVTEGGNMEFVFNTIDQYRDGINNGGTTAGTDVFYNTYFEIASSTEWELDFGAETSQMFGTDDPSNTILTNNIGFAMSEMSTSSSCCVATSDIFQPLSDAVASGAAGVVNGLGLYNSTASQNPLLSSGAAENAGDVTENNFVIHWEVGTTITAGVEDMNIVTLLDQSVSPDRYVVNVFMDLNSIP